MRKPAVLWITLTILLSAMFSSPEENPYQAASSLHVGPLAGLASAPAAVRAHSSTVPQLVPVVPIWQQVNTNGFGDPQTGEVTALGVFNGYLYAGTHNPVAPGPIPVFDGAQVFRSLDGVTWAPVTQPGFGTAHDIAAPSILDLTVFNGQLYASTGQGDGPAQIWRTLDGVNWSPMNITGFSNPDTVDISVLAEYKGMIYAGAANLVSGAQIWRSLSGDNNTWMQVAPATPGTAPASVSGFAVFGGDLYAIIESDAPVQIWRSSGGGWTTVKSDGFGSDFTTLTGGMAALAGYLYVGVGNTTSGAQLWRTPDGVSWQQVAIPGFADPNNQKVDLVFVFQNRLYVSLKNTQTGIELWRSPDGALWEQANLDGFGDSHNTGSNRSNASADFVGQLYVGTSNALDGGELWRMKQKCMWIPSIQH